MLICFYRLVAVLQAWKDGKSECKGVQKVEVSYIYSPKEVVFKQFLIAHPMILNQHGLFR